MNKEDSDAGFKDTMRLFCLKLLEDYFRSACQEVHGLPYVHNIEFALWKALQGSPDEMEYLRIDERDVQFLKTVSEKLGGWLTIKPSTDEFMFVSTPNWERRFELWSKES